MTISREEAAELLLHEIVDAWEALPGGRQYGLLTVERWVNGDIAPVVNEIRAFLGRPKPGEG